MLGYPEIARRQLPETISLFINKFLSILGNHERLSIKVTGRIDRRYVDVRVESDDLIAYLYIRESGWMIEFRKHSFTEIQAVDPVTRENLVRLGARSVWIVSRGAGAEIKLVGNGAKYMGFLPGVPWRLT